MRYELISPLSWPGYDRLVGDAPGGSFFHSAAWARVLSESYGFRPRYLAAAEEGRLGVLVPLMEVWKPLTGRKGVCLPFTDECSPILSEGLDTEEMAKSLFSWGRSLGWRSIEWRGGGGLLHRAVPSLSYLAHRVDLSMGEERLFGSFRDSTRRNVLKALKQGVEVRAQTDLEAIRVFYKLQCLTRKRHGLPPQPLGFFMKLWEHAISVGKGFVVLAYKRGVAVSGSVFLYLGRQGIYKYGASSPAAEPLRANNLVMWEGMRECMRRGCTALSLGRTEPGHTGLLQFKRGWGGLEEPINYYRYDLRSNGFVAFRPGENGWYTGLLSRLPVPLLRFLGAVLYPHMA